MSGNDPERSRSSSLLHTNAPLSPAFHALVPSSLDPIPPPANKAKWALGCGGRKEARGKKKQQHTQMGKEGGQVHNNKHARKGGTIRNINHGLERQRWHLRRGHTCSKLHACSVELYKEPRVTAATPAAPAAAAVVMVTITMVGVDQTTGGSIASLT